VSKGSKKYDFCQITAKCFALSYGVAVVKKMPVSKILKSLDTGKNKN
jgi:hypothetical protein